MKPTPPPDVPGDTDFERFDNAVRKVLTVPKDAVVEREHTKKPAEKKPPKPQK